MSGHSCHTQTVQASLQLTPSLPLPLDATIYQDGKKRTATVSIIQILALVALFFIFAYFWVSAAGGMGCEAGRGMQCRCCAPARQPEQH